MPDVDADSDFPYANITVGISAHVQDGSDDAHQCAADYTCTWRGQRDAEGRDDYHDSMVWRIGSAVGAALVRFFPVPADLNYALDAIMGTCEEHIMDAEKKAQKTKCQQNQQ